MLYQEMFSSKSCFSTIRFMIFWNLLMVEKMLLSPHTKLCAIISKKLVSRVPLGNQEISGKSQNLMKLLLSAYSSSWSKNLISTSKKNPENKKLSFSRSALCHMKTGACLKYFVNYFFWIYCLGFNSTKILQILFVSQFL